MIKYIFILLAFIINHYAQTSKITGYVFDENGSKLLGANVILQNTNYGTSTDIDGFFLLDNLVKGKYVVEISMVGFTRFVSKEIILDENSTEKLNVILTHSSFELDEVIIRDLIQQGAKISVWGVGTNLVTSKGQSALDGVYKILRD